MFLTKVIFIAMQVAGTSGKAILEGGSDDEGSSTEAHGRAIIDVLGRDKRNEVLAAVYMVRTDVSLSVRQVITLLLYLALQDILCRFICFAFIPQEVSAIKPYPYFYFFIFFFLFSCLFVI